MLIKILLPIVLFQLSATMVMADTCNLYFNTTDYTLNGPFLVESRRCYELGAIKSTVNHESAWIGGNSPGTGSLNFYSDDNCKYLATEGPSPINLQGLTIGSVLVFSCI